MNNSQHPYSDNNGSFIRWGRSDEELRSLRRLGLPWPTFVSDSQRERIRLRDERESYSSRRRQDALLEARRNRRRNAARTQQQRWRRNHVAFVPIGRPQLRRRGAPHLGFNIFPARIYNRRTGTFRYRIGDTGLPRATPPNNLETIYDVSTPSQTTLNQHMTNSTQLVMEPTNVSQIYRSFMSQDRRSANTRWYNNAMS